MTRLLAFLALAVSALAATTNYKSGIDVTFGGVEGTAWAREHFYHDQLVSDFAVVYIRDDTDITMAHNDRNMATYRSTDPLPLKGRSIIGASGGGIIRYKVDRDRQFYYLWSDDLEQTKTARLLPEYTAPFAFEDLTYDGSTPVVGTTGDNGGDPTDKADYYWRGILDTANVTGGGDEWHVLTYADDSNLILREPPIGTNTGGFVDPSGYADDGKLILFVVNPKTPCLTLDVTGAGQFYTTPPKAYWTPKICAQTSYIRPSTGTVTLTLHDIYGNDIFYRINGGSFTDANSATVVLDDGDFSDGSNTLEYYYDGNSAYTKTRIVVKNPAFPSAAEDHGNMLWVDGAGYTTVANRITRAPYLSSYNSYKTSYGNSGHENWDDWAGQGYRINQTATTFLQGISYSLKNAFVAKVEGFTYTRSGDSKSFGQYAKEMLLESPRTIMPIGMEGNHSADAVPGREIEYRGYYDAFPTLTDAFAYDIMIGNYRSDQVAGGITPIEDYFMRDNLAMLVYEALFWSGGYVGGDNFNEPGMWGGARQLAAVSIGIIMPEYSTEYYGTSGFGTVQDVFPYCPFPDQELTWKEAIYDGDQTKMGYPNLKYYMSLSSDDPLSLITFEGQTDSEGNVYPEGTWADKSDYLSYGLFGIHLSIYSNMIHLWLSGAVNDRFEILLNTMTSYPNYTIGVKSFKDTSGTAIISAASPGVVSWTNHQLPNNSPVYFTGSSLPSPLVANTTYYVTGATANAFNVSSTVGGAAINTTGGSGSQTANAWPAVWLPFITNLNQRWPFAATNATAEVQDLASNDPNSDDRQMSDASVFGFAWYADNYYGTGSVPGVPGSFTATTISNSAINLDWDASSGTVTGYKVYRSLTSGSGWVLIGQPTSTDYSDTGLASATTYYYEVKGYNDAGDSTAASDDATTDAAPPLKAGDSVGTAKVLSAQ